MKTRAYVWAWLARWAMAEADALDGIGSWPPRAPSAEQHGRAQVLRERAEYYARKAELVAGVEPGSDEAQALWRDAWDAFEIPQVPA